MAGTKTQTGGLWKGRLGDSDKGRRLLASSAFQEALAEGRHSGPGPTAEVLRRELGISDGDLAAADAELDRLLADSERHEASDAAMPRPSGRQPKGDSGNVRVRMPRTLHKELAQQADREGVSLNTLIVTYLAREAGIQAAASGNAIAPSEA